jgi:hypothetical protein
MNFENISDVQEFLEKTTSIEDRIHTSLILLNGKFSELGDIVSKLKKFSSLYRKEKGNASENNDRYHVL